MRTRPGALRAAVAAIPLAIAVSSTACFYPATSSRRVHNAAYLVDVAVAVTGAVSASALWCGKHLEDNGVCQQRYMAAGVVLIGLGSLSVVVNAFLEKETIPCGPLANTMNCRARAQRWTPWHVPPPDDDRE